LPLAKRGYGKGEGEGKGKANRSGMGKGDVEGEGEGKPNGSGMGKAPRRAPFMAHSLFVVDVTAVSGVFRFLYCIRKE
jgi:hypothetical protein